MLILTHSDYLVTDAGVEKVIQGHQKLFLENETNFIAVYPIRKDIQIFGMVHSSTTAIYGLIVNGKNQGTINHQEFMKLLEIEGLRAVIIHELVTFKKNQKLFDFFDKIRCPIYYFVHDYAMICYNHTLMRNNKEFCGTEPISLKKCKNCRFYLEGLVNKKWHNQFVERYKNIIYLFPSTIVKDIWESTFHVKNELRIVPNTKFGSQMQNYLSKTQNKKIRIAFIGYGRVEKGWHTWKKICQKYSDMYDLYVLGDGVCEGKVKTIPVSVAKNGPNAMIETIRSNNIDIAFLWSTRPETYSYTFFESYVSGCYILSCKESGNISNMIDKYNCGNVFKNEQELFEFLDCEKIVREYVENMKKQKLEYPLNLEENDEILYLVEECL